MYKMRMNWKTTILEILAYKVKPGESKKSLCLLTLIQSHVQKVENISVTLFVALMSVLSDGLIFSVIIEIKSKWLK